jgi:ubiquitin-conjugating enzyme E2 S
MASSLNTENISPGIIISVAKELRKLCTEPLEGIKVTLNEEEVTDVTAEIVGPESTPFENGVFKIKLVLPSEYPQAPPKGYFLTKIFHPNISKTGEICVNTLKKDWRADLGIGHVLQVVRCLLINPFPESALNEEAGKLFMEDYDSYFRKAQMMTEVHALAKKGEASGAAAGEGGEGSASEPVEKRQKQPADADKAAEKRRQDKKKSLKRL